MKNLTSLKINKYATIAGFLPCLAPSIARRLLELGLLKGEKIKVLRKSLLGRAFLIELRYYTLTIKRDIAQTVLVEGE